MIDINKLKRVSVLGMGKSGLEVGRFFSSRNIDVFLSDSADRSKLQETTSLLDRLGIAYEVGIHTDKVWKDKDLVVISPGISVENPAVKNIKDNGIPVVSELELAFQLSKAPFIAVTGTNGKSTTTTLIGNFLSLAGWDVIVGGNIGIPLVEKAYNAKKEQLIVAEVSSFQLELVKHFRPYISLLLNISSDHLDRHGSLENYLNYKCRIFTQQKKGDYVLINYDDPLLMSIVDKIEADVLFFSSRAQLKNGIFLHNNAIYYKNGSSHCEICNIQDIPLQGEHNLKNIMAAMLVALIYKVPSHSILESLHNFKTLRHRMEFVTDIEGVYFIDDSKGTNPDAVMAALNTFKEPVILIAGGVDKKLDFSELCKFIARRVKGLILIGTTSDILYNYCSQNGLLQIMRASTIEDAVKRAYSIAEKGDVVLLSPGGASFDMFKNADDRGDKFIQAVKNLKNRIVR